MERISMKISGIGMAVPDMVMTNADLVTKLEKLGIETSDAWIRERTGIRERHVAPPETGVAFYGAIAARQALEHAGVNPEDVAFILCATETEDMGFPATACLIQTMIGAWNATCPDLGAGCAGTGVALMIANSLIVSGARKNCLIIGGDLLSTIANFEDRQTCVLLADGVGALFCEGTTESVFYAERSGSDGRLANLITLPAGGSLRPIDSPETLGKNLHKLRMDGREVFKAAVRTLSRLIPDCLEQAGLSIQDIGMWLFHQANIRIIDETCGKTGIRPDRVFNTIERYGNTSNGSMIIGACKAYEAGLLKPGMKVAFVSFGSGFTWAMVVIEWTV